MTRLKKKSTSTKKGKRSGISASRIADWAESHVQTTVLPAVQEPPAERHAVGRGSAMLQEEIDAVRLAFLTGQFNRSQLAEKFGRTRNTIARCLEGREFEELRRVTDLEVRDEIRRRMIAKADTAITNWELSMGVAADRGDHKPSKDWLMHAGVIDPVESTETGPKVIVQIGVSAHDVIIGVRADGSHIKGDDPESPLIR